MLTEKWSWVIYYRIRAYISAVDVWNFFQFIFVVISPNFNCRIIVFLRFVIFFVCVVIVEKFFSWYFFQNCRVSRLTRLIQNFLRWWFSFSSLIGPRKEFWSIVAKNVEKWTRLLNTSLLQLNLPLANFDCMKSILNFKIAFWCSQKLPKSRSNINHSSSYPRDKNISGLPSSFELSSNAASPWTSIEILPEFYVAIPNMTNNLWLIVWCGKTWVSDFQRKWIKV